MREERPGKGIINALSVDVEDWIQSSLDNSFHITEQVLINTRKLLELLRQCNVRATNSLIW
jgi:hypothetical protein